MSYPVPYGYTTQIVAPLPRRSSTAHIVVAWVLAIASGLYLLPWAIAATRNKQRLAPIVLINIFLGWSLVGWIVALVMACTSDQPAAVVITHQPIGYGTSPLPAYGPPGFSGYQPSGYPPANYPQAGYQPANYRPAGYQPGLPGPNPRTAPSNETRWPTSQPTAPYAPYAPPADLPSGDEPTRVIEDLRNPGAF